MMKKKLFFGMMGAIALTFTACTSEDNLAEVNPNYNAETGTVNADFVINVATDNTETADQTSSRRVFELALPTESNALLFYGKAIKDDTDAKEGKIDWKVAEDISQNSFKLCPILSDANEKAKFEETENLLAAYLNVLCETGITNETLTFGTQSAMVASLKWRKTAAPLRRTRASRRRPARQGFGRAGALPVRRWSSWRTIRAWRSTRWGASLEYIRPVISDTTLPMRRRTGCFWSA